MKKKYFGIEAKVILLDEEDVVRTSLGGEDQEGMFDYNIYFGSF